MGYFPSELQKRIYFAINWKVWDIKPNILFAFIPIEVPIFSQEKHIVLEWRRCRSSSQLMTCIIISVFCRHLQFFCHCLDSPVLQLMKLSTKYQIPFDNGLHLCRGNLFKLLSFSLTQMFLLCILEQQFYLYLCLWLCLYLYLYLCAIISTSVSVFE